VEFKAESVEEAHLRKSVLLKRASEPSGPGVMANHHALKVPSNQAYLRQER
jgi:hypothetical protein